MLRLAELGLLLAPFIAFAAWRYFAVDGVPPTKLLVALACLLVLLAASLVWLNREQALPSDQPYTPAQLQDGRVVSGPPGQ